MFKRNLLLAAAMLCFTSAFAQQSDEGLDYEPYPYNFVQLQGGASVLLRKDMQLSPTASVGFGRFFSPAFGARLHVNGWESKNGFTTSEPFSVPVTDESVEADYQEGVRDVSNTYKFNYLTTDLDLLINLNNLFKGNNNHFLNVIFVGGVGLSYAWHNNELRDLLPAKSQYLSPDVTANAWGVNGSKRDHLWSHNLRAGLLFDFNLAKHFNVGLECDVNSLSDDFNSRYSNSDDWMLTAQLTLTYKFGFKPRKQTFVQPVQPVQPYDNTRDNEQTVATPPVVEKATPAPPKSHIEVFFDINSSELKEAEAAKIENLANWLKKYPNTSVSLTGYADKGTGTQAINRRLSQERVDAVAKQLTDKYGISSSRITTDFRGDTEQPFGENDMNRAVVGEATE